MAGIRDHYLAAHAEMTVFERSENPTLSPIALKRKVTVALEKELAFVLSIPSVVYFEPDWEHEMMLPECVQKERKEIRSQLTGDFKHFHATMVGYTLSARCPNLTSATVTELAYCIAHKHEEVKWFLNNRTGELIPRPILPITKRRVP